MLKTNLVEHFELKGFFRHPYYKRYFVSKNGVVYDDHEKKYPELGISSEYVSLTCFGKTVHLHRLICETFLLIPDTIPFEKLVVNHKNGIKTDNRLENLEWTSFSGNSIHAYVNNFRSDNKPVLIKDIRTGIVKRFYSLQECARFFKVNGSLIHNHLRSVNYGKICFKQYLIIFEGCDWPDISINDLTKHRNGTPKDVMVYDKHKKQIIIFEGASSAAEYVKMKPHTFYRRLNETKETWYETDDWKARFLTDSTEKLPDLVFFKSKIRHLSSAMGNRKPIQINVQNMETKEEKIYNSSKDLADELGVNKNTLQKHLWCNNNVWKKYLKVTYLKQASPSD